MSTGPSPQFAPRPAFWPTREQYSAAMQNLHASMTDLELRDGQAALSPRGLPLVFAGGFANVYQIRCPRTGKTWAVKLFKHGADGLQQRYQAISRHLRQANLPFLVDFEYLPEGVLIDGGLFPLVKMRWVEGVNLQRFVEQSLDQPRMLDQLLALWGKVAGRLDAAGIAHGDLQHGNVLLVPKGEQGSLLLTLIDFDGMYVPELAGRPSGEVGLAAYQHPSRTPRNALYGPTVDRFSHLTICCALRCLREGGRGLWERFSHDEGLLFKGEDFQQPSQSTLFRELWTFRHADARALVGHLALACQRPLHETPLISDLVAGGRVRPLNQNEQQDVTALLAPAAQLSTPAVTVPKSSRTPLPIAKPLTPQANDRLNREAFVVTPVVIATVTTTAASPKVVNPNESPLGDNEWINPWSRAARRAVSATMANPISTLLISALVCAPILLTVTLLRNPGSLESPTSPPIHSSIASLQDDARSRRASQTAPIESDARTARDDAYRAWRAVKAMLATELQPPSLVEAELHFEEADTKFNAADYRDAAKLYRQAAEKLAIAKRDMSDCNELGEMRREWMELLTTCTPVLQGTSEAPVLSSSESRRDLAEAGLTRGDYGDAKKQYRDALDMLKQARSRITEQTTQVTALVRELETALKSHDSHTALNALARIENIDASDPRLTAWKGQVLDLDRRFPVGRPPFAPGETIPSKENGLKLKLALIPAGAMLRNGPIDPRTLRKTHAHIVGISKPFFLSTTEVTIHDVLLWLNEVANVDPSWIDTKSPSCAVLRSQGRYPYVMRGAASTFGRADNQPMVFISHAGAEAFCVWLSKKEERRYRLPTEAEWEYAARAESGTTSESSNISAPEYAWTRKNSQHRTHSVGSKLPNPFGLHDMVGNVSEWCSDWHDPTFGRGLTDPTMVDPSGPSIGDGRVVRGGNWDSHSLGDVLSSRHPVPSMERNNYVGFRVALDYASVVTNCDDSIEASIGLKLKRISAGEFTMGAGSGVAAEEPPHRVRISRDFYLGIYEVTQSEYQKVTGLRPSRYSGKDLPVGNVSIEDAKNFCRLLNEKERSEGRLPWRMEYRLPTEAQWEYAARAATSMKWVWGEREGDDVDHAWISGNSSSRPQAIGLKQPNAWGIHDLAGNMSELVLDEYDEDCYRKRSLALAVDPFVAKSTRGSAVARGGSFGDSANDCRSAARRECPSGDPRLYTIGFRVALVAVETP